MNKNEIKHSLINEVNAIETPNVLEKVLMSKDEQFKEKQHDAPKTKIIFKWVMASLSFFVLILTFIFTLQIITFDGTVFATVSLDVNPSIELVLNKNDQVIDLISYNYEGENLILNISYKRQDVDNVIEKITDKLVQQEFISNQNNFLYFTIDCSNSSTKTRLQTKVKNQIIHSCQKNQIILSDEEIVFGNINNQNGNVYGISKSKYNYLVSGWDEMTDKSEYITFENFANAMKNKSMIYIKNYIESHQ
jgi:hypothetical protein